MRLLVLNYEFPPIGGGASTASYNLAMEFAHRGHTVDVLTCRVADQPAVEYINGVTVYRVTSIRTGPHETGLFGAVTYLCAAYFKLRALLKLQRYDYAHFFFALPTGLLSFLWHKTTHQRYTVSLRGSDVPGYDQESIVLRYLHQALLPVTRKILARAHHVVANSESLRRLALESFPEIPILVITNGVAETKFMPVSRKRSADKTIHALCVSRLIRRKGIPHLFQAIKQCNIPNLKVSIVGVGAQERSLHGLAREFGIQDQVEFLGQQSQEALIECYRNADFLVHPALTESFSMTLLEAMASGLPIVATSVGGIPELVVDRENGILFPPGNVSALSQAMTDICSDANQKSTYIKNNRTKILTGFTWTHIAEQYLQRFFDDSSQYTAPLHPSMLCVCTIPSP